MGRIKILLKILVYVVGVIVVVDDSNISYWIYCIFQNWNGYILNNILSIIQIIVIYA